MANRIQGSTAARKASSATDRADRREIRRYLIVEHGGGLYGADVRAIREILPFRAVDAVPGMDGYLRGTIGLRNSILPVMDLDTRLGGPRGTISSRSCILVLRVANENDYGDIGVVVDAVWQIGEIPLSAIAHGSPPASGIRAEHILGLSRIGSREVTFLDMPGLIRADPAATCLAPLCKFPPKRSPP